MQCLREKEIEEDANVEEAQKRETAKKPEEKEEKTEAEEKGKGWRWPHLLHLKKGKKSNEKEEEKEKEEEETEGEVFEGEMVNISTYAIIRAIEKGRDGFGKNAFLNWQDLRYYDVSEKHTTSLLEKARIISRKYYEIMKASFIRLFTRVAENMAKWAEKLKKKVGKKAKHSRNELENDPTVDEDTSSMVNELRTNLKGPALELNDEIKKLIEAEKIRADDKTKNEAVKKLKNLRAKQEHPFDFLATVRYGISVLPNNSDFFGHKKIGMELYEKIKNNSLSAEEKELELSKIFTSKKDKKKLEDLEKVLDRTHGCWSLKHALEEVLFDKSALNKHDVVLHDLRGRLGAQVFTLQVFCYYI